ncbi:MAG TPA: hypothetical protein VGC10_03805 [Sphingomonas sp.]
MGERKLRREDDVAHILASLMFGLILLTTTGLIAFMLFDSRARIAAALGLTVARSVRLAPVSRVSRRGPRQGSSDADMIGVSAGGIPARCLVRA